MSKKAIIYGRVATSDQDSSINSLLNQEKQLRTYCRAYNITIVEHYQDIDSGFTFHRPQFKKLLRYCNQNSENIDLLLFVDWSRFSRNVSKSYLMIEEFEKLKIELRSLETHTNLIKYIFSSSLK